MWMLPATSDLHQVGGLAIVIFCFHVIPLPYAHQSEISQRFAKAVIGLTGGSLVQFDGPIEERPGQAKLSGCGADHSQVIEHPGEATGSTILFY